MAIIVEGIIAMTTILWKENERDKDGWKMEGNRTGSVDASSVSCSTGDLPCYLETF